MKKTILAIIIATFTTTSFAQTKKAPADNLETVKAIALKWFKEEYVSATFKDKYSYKPLETKIEIVNYSTKLAEDTLALNSRINRLTFDADTSIFQLQIKWADADLKKIGEYEAKINDKKEASMKEFYIRSLEDKKKAYVISIKSIEEQRAKKAEAQRELDKTIQLKQQISTMLASLTESEKNTFGYYLIKHDCHANNSYGGTILGQYSFKFKNGVGYDVVKTN